MPYSVSGSKRFAPGDASENDHTDEQDSGLDDRQRRGQGFVFEIRQVEFLTLLGPSGCGKTTTLMCIAGLHQPEAGEIWLDNECLTSVAQGISSPPERRG